MVLPDDRVSDSSSAVSHLALALFLILSSLHFLSQEAGARREGRDEEFWMEDHLGDSALYIFTYPLTIVPRTNMCVLNL